MLQAQAVRKDWELGKLVTLGGWVIFILAEEAPPVLLAVECMGNVGVETCPVWFGAQRQTVVVAGF